MVPWVWTTQVCIWYNFLYYKDVLYTIVIDCHREGIIVLDPRKGFRVWSSISDIRHLRPTASQTNVLWGEWPVLSTRRYTQLRDGIVLTTVISLAIDSWPFAKSPRVECEMPARIFRVVLNNILIGTPWIFESMDMIIYTHGSGPVNGPYNRQMVCI